MLSETQVVTCADEKTLCLSLDWSDRRGASGRVGALISFLMANLSIFKGRETGSISIRWSNLHPGRRVGTFSHINLGSPRL